MAATASRFGLRGGLGGVELGCRVGRLGGGLLLQLVGLCLGLVGLGIRDQLVGIGVLGVGAGLLLFQLAQRRGERLCVFRCHGGGLLGFVGRPRGLLGLGGEFVDAAGAAAMASLLGTNSAGCEKSTGAASFGEMITRMPILVLSNKLSAKPKGIRTQPCEAA